MRWQAQALTNAASEAEQAAPALPGLGSFPDLVRTVTTPEFAGITFHEVLARSALNKVPGDSSVPFGWTINPYRGCSHACVYCFARPTHTYLDFDAGTDFDTQLVVKINIAEVLTRELRKASWGHQPVALGTNTDPYQRAEGRYRLMPGVITALSESGTPFSVLTKGTLARRDLPLLVGAADRVPVGLGVSLALLDEELHQALEPGAPSPRARLDLVRAITAAGLPCQVLVAPILPLITDTDDELDAVLAAIAAAGATGASVMALHLRPGTREWFWRWLERNRPDLVPAYDELYRGGAYVVRSYASDLGRRAADLLRRHGLDGSPTLREPLPRARSASPRLPAMRYAPLGSTGLSVSHLSFGTAPLGGLFGPVDEADAIDLVHEALDLGITFVDTSPYYGNAEERLGRALRGRRDQVVLGTKAGRYGAADFDFSPARLRRSVEQSLRLLHTDHVDLLQLHDVEFVPLGPVLDDSYAELLAMRDDGLCRFIGMTGYPVPTMVRAMEETDLDVVLTYAHATLLDDSLLREVTPVAARRGVGLINAAAVALGLLTPHGSSMGDGHPAGPQIRGAAAAMAELCAERGVDLAFVANQYAIQRSGCATTLIGTGRSSHLRSAVDAVEAELDDELVAELIALRPVPAAQTWRSGLPENDPH